MIVILFMGVITRNMFMEIITRSLFRGIIIRNMFRGVITGNMFRGIINRNIKFKGSERQGGKELGWSPERFWVFCG